jgi:hypothetical protein
MSKKIDLGGVGPPRDGEGRDNNPADAQQLDDTTATHAKSTTAPRQCGGDTVAQLRRRRAASCRLPSLDCGCRDPWPCTCTEPPLSEQWITAARFAALHILDAGEIPLLEIETLRALYRRGGMDRSLAEMLHAATGGEIR